MECLNPPPLRHYHKDGSFLLIHNYKSHVNVLHMTGGGVREIAWEPRSGMSRRDVLGSGVATSLVMGWLEGFNDAVSHYLAASQQASPAPSGPLAPPYLSRYSTSYLGQRL